MIPTLAEILVVGLVVLVLYGLRHRLGLMPLFMFVGANQWVQGWLALTVHLDVLGRFPVSPGSARNFTVETSGKAVGLSISAAK